MIKLNELLNKEILDGLLVKILPVPKTDIKKEIMICYSFFSSLFGKIVVASIPQGVCFVGCAISHKAVLFELHKRFPNAIFKLQKNKQHEQVKKIFNGNWKSKESLFLYLKGTSFQLTVWTELLKIPFGTLSTYRKIAEIIGYPKAQRAVGTAIGKNPIFYIIPCHRVIAQNGTLGGFYWGIEKKKELLSAENADYLHFTS